MEEDTGHNKARGLERDRRDIWTSPDFFKPVRESSLELEWQIFKRTQLEESAIAYDVGGMSKLQL
jgi:hypothetical protein